MAKRWIALLVLLALGVGASLLFNERAGPAPGAAPSLSATLTEPADSDALLGVEELQKDQAPRAALPSEDLSSGLPSVAPEVPFEYESPPANGIDILVLHAKDRTPVAGAHVVYADDKALTSEERQGFKKGTVSFDDFIDDHGRHFRSDEKGLVRIPNTNSSGILVGFSDTLYGFMEFRSQQEENATLLLNYDPETLIRVTNSAGAPQPRVAVFLRSIRGDDSRRDFIGVLTEPDTGIAKLRHALMLKKELDIQGEVYAGVKALLRNPVEVIIPTDPFTDQILELQLPDCGSLRLHILQPDGAPVQGTCLVYANLEASSEMPELEQIARFQKGTIAIGVDGIVEFEHVALSEHISLQIEPWVGYEPAWEEIQGPTQIGEWIEHTIYLREQRPHMSGRLLDSKGSPMPNQHCKVALYGDQLLLNHEDFRSDENGRFRFRFHGKYTAGKAIAFILQSKVKDSPLSSFVHFTGSPVSGSNDLGDVILMPSPRIISGRVLSSDGQAVSNAIVNLYVPIKANAKSDWKPLWEYQVTSDSTGSFAILGQLMAKKLALTAQHPMHLKSERLEIANSEESIQLRLKPGGMIRGRLLFDKGLEIGHLIIKAFPQGAPEKEVRKAILNKEGHFKFLSLAAGNYEIRPTLRQEKSCSLDGFQIQINPAGESVVQEFDIDLRGLVRTLRIQLTDSNGLQLDGYLRSPKDAQGHSIQYPIRSKTATITTCLPSLDLEAFSNGYRTQQLVAVGEDRVVIMQKGIEVTFIADGLPIPQGEVKLHVGLRAVDRSRDQGNSFTMIKSDFEQGRATLLVWSPGLYEAYLTTSRSRPNGGTSIFYSSAGAVMECEVIDTQDPQVFRLELSAELLKTLQ